MSREKSFSFFNYKKETMQDLWKLGAPTIAEQALQTLVVYIDTAMVGHIGAYASAAVGLTTTVGWLFNGVFFAASIGVLSFIARSVGAGDKKAAHSASIQALWLLLAIGILESLVGIKISDVLPKWMGASRELWEESSSYFLIITYATLFRGAIILYSNVLRANKDSKTPMIINISVNILNIILNQLLIGDSTKFDICGRSIEFAGAGLGVRGAALATMASQILGGSVIMIAVMKNKDTTFIGQKISVDQKIMKECIRVAIPLTAERFAVGMGHVVFTVFVTSLGTLSIAAHTIAMNIEQAFYVPGYGIQTAVSTLIGNAAGEKNEKRLKEVTRVGLLSAVGAMSVMSIVLFLGAGGIMGIFTSEKEVILLGTAVLRIVAVSEPLFAVMIIFEGVFHGMGDTKIPFLFAVFTMWGIRICFTYLGIRFFQIDLKMVWVCMVLDNVSRCILLTIWYKMNRWKKYLGMMKESKILEK